MGENEPLILEQQEPVTGDDLLLIRRAAEVACVQAAEIVAERPDDAALLSKLARWGRVYCATVERALAHPRPRTVAANDGKPDKSGKRKSVAAAGLPKMKHVYGPNGLCAVEHEPGHVCGKARERAPRGSAAATAVHLPANPAQANLDISPAAGPSNAE